MIGAAAMQRIAEWLEKLGMSEYTQRFAENGINVAALRHLTDQDLKDIGVLLGHRRVMLAAIGELGGPAAAPPAREATVEPKHQDTAERRQVTVMLSDLVGSTALSARMDPEDLREIISAYQKCVAETVSRFGGFVAKYMGDGVLVYFGYPQAHEDDAERAVSTAQRQSAKLWELRAAASLARLWRDQGKRTEARDLLAPVYGWFTEGFDTRDLKEAKDLLDELAS
jgi:class 3 adenylate cyclase